MRIIASLLSKSTYIHCYLECIQRNLLNITVYRYISCTRNKRHLFLYFIEIIKGQVEDWKIVINIVLSSGSMGINMARCGEDIRYAKVYRKAGMRYFKKSFK